MDSAFSDVRSLAEDGTRTFRCRDWNVTRMAVPTPAHLFDVDAFCDSQGIPKHFTNQLLT